MTPRPLAASASQHQGHAQNHRILGRRVPLARSPGCGCRALAGGTGNSRSECRSGADPRAGHPESTPARPGSWKSVSGSPSSAPAATEEGIAASVPADACGPETRRCAGSRRRTAASCRGSGSETRRDRSRDTVAVEGTLIAIPQARSPPEQRLARRPAAPPLTRSVRFSLRDARGRVTGGAGGIAWGLPGPRCAGPQWIRKWGIVSTCCVLPGFGELRDPPARNEQKAHHYGIGSKLLERKFPQTPRCQQLSWKESFPGKRSSTSLRAASWSDATADAGGVARLAPGLLATGGSEGLGLRFISVHLRQIPAQPRMEGCVWGQSPTWIACPGALMW